MMWRKLFIVSVVLVFSLILSSLSMWADEGDEGATSFVPCEQIDLQGTWSARVGAKDESGSHLCWEACTLTVDALGVVEASGTYVDCSEVASDITGGELIISSGCIIQGTIETTNGIVYVATGAIVNNELVLGKTAE